MSETHPDVTPERIAMEKEKKLRIQIANARAELERINNLLEDVRARQADVFAEYVQALDALLGLKGRAPVGDNCALCPAREIADEYSQHANPGQV